MELIGEFFGKIFAEYIIKIITPLTSCTKAEYKVISLVIKTFFTIISCGLIMLLMVGITILSDTNYNDTTGWVCLVIPIIYFLCAIILTIIKLFRHK